MRERWRKFNIEMVTADENLSCGSTRFDALFISTKNNPMRVTELFREVCQLSIASEIFFIGSSHADTPIITKNNLSVSKQYNKFCDSIWCNPNYKEWDLPNKRNFAIWFSKKNNFNKILLMDDDIRFTIDQKLSYKLATALDSNWVSGAYSTGEFDTSIIGAIAMRFGINRPVFLSGNCLAINLKKFIPYFPNIYNEDWLSILPAIVAKKATIVGPVLQLTRIVKDAKKRAKFQEFGEVIVDEIYSRIIEVENHRYLNELFIQMSEGCYWEMVLKDRDEWLADLGSCVGQTCNEDIEIIRAVREELSKINAKDCVSFINDWRWENELWCASLNYHNQFVHKEIIKNGKDLRFSNS